MPSNTFTISALLGTFCLSLGVAANSGYAASCNSMEIVPPDSHVNHYAIVADCNKGNGDYLVNTNINIGHCFGNQNGNLVGEVRGVFGETCNSVSLKGTILHATCGDGKGGYKATSIDTNQWIGNAGGTMCCFNICGDGS